MMGAQYNLQNGPFKGFMRFERKKERKKLLQLPGRKLILLIGGA
jgi:hypothetical protein